MKNRIRLSLAWMAVLAAGGVATADGSADPAAISVFADLRHTGTLSGPLPASPTAADEFAIAVPLPASAADKDELPAQAAERENIAERLGLLRVETKPGAGSFRFRSRARMIVACTSFARLIVSGAAAPKDGRSWTFAPGSTGILELAVGVVLPEAKPAATDPVWPRSSPSRSDPRPPAATASACRFVWRPF